MEILTFIVDFFNVIAWPVAVVVIVMVLRKYIPPLIEAFHPHKRRESKGDHHKKE